MAQRSITSFFKRTSAEETSPKEESPAKRKKLEDVNSNTTPQKKASPIQQKISPIKKQVLSDKKSASPSKKQDSSPSKSDSSPHKSPKSSPIKTEVKTPQNDNEKSPVKPSESKTATDPPPASKNFLGLTPEVSAPTYNPAKSHYHPTKDAYWKPKQKVPYYALARTFQIIEDTGSRLKMIEVLANFFRSVIVLSKQDLLACIYLSLNQLAPAYEGLELGVAETGLLKAIAQSTGRTLNQVKTDVQNLGDIGIVAEQSKSKVRVMFKPQALTVECVFAKFKTIAKMSGTSSMAKKIDIIQSLLVAGQQIEARYIIRSLAGKLRIGIAEQSLLQALAQACAFTTPNTETYTEKDLNRLESKSENTIKTKVEEVALKVKAAYCRCPNYEIVVKTILETGVDTLEEHCKVVPGVPLKPMLALPTKGVSDIFNRFESIEFTCEWKYDGERAQIHSDEKGNTSIFSRNSENNTTKYPDIIARLDSLKKEGTNSFILDAEVVAWDEQNKKILPFQILTTRKRKDVSENEIKIKVCVFLFDLLYLNGESLIEMPFIKRRELLYNHFNKVEGLWMFATHVDTHDVEKVQAFLEEAVKGNCEGLMIKSLKKDAAYEIAKRSKSWLKLKKDYVDTMGDTLDLVVIGGYYGKGKRHGNYGGFLLACYDPENEEYQSICKLGTGFSDEDLATHSAFFKDHILKAPKHYYRFDSSTSPDEWFEPVQVWEIKCADLSISPVYKAAVGIVDPEKGISLRFPRFIRIRTDKSVEDSTNAQQIADFYSNQDQIKNANEVDQSDDYY